MEIIQTVYFLIFPIVCFLIAKEKGRSPWGWAIAGLFFQFIALIIVAVASDLEKEELLRSQVTGLSDELSATKLGHATKVDDSKERICEQCQLLSPLNICAQFKVEIQKNIVECEHFQENNV